MARYLCPEGVFHFWEGARRADPFAALTPSPDRIEIRFCPDHDEPPQSEGQDHRQHQEAALEQREVH